MPAPLASNLPPAPASLPPEPGSPDAADEGDKSGPRTTTGHGPGDKIGGKYRLVRLLGQGGMGSVWHARNLALATDVALKLIRPWEDDDEEAEDEANERLLREARAAAAIDHPNVVRVLDFGRSNMGEPFIVMELLRGTPLSQLVDTRGKMPPEDAVRLLLHVVSALAAAHEKGVIHRDLKPDNVMLTSTAEGAVVPKVFDFGIAKLERNDDGKQLTLDGVVIGSPEYMAPEQTRSAHDVDERADVWSVCVMLYEAIAGCRPFDGTNVNDMLYAVITHDPAPIPEIAAGDPSLWAILEKGLRKPVEERWPSMTALSQALTAWLATTTTSPEPTLASLDLLGPMKRSAPVKLPRAPLEPALPPLQPQPRTPPPEPTLASLQPPPTIASSPPKSTSLAPTTTSLQPPRRSHSPGQYALTPLRAPHSLRPQRTARLAMIAAGLALSAAVVAAYLALVPTPASAPPNLAAAAPTPTPLPPDPLPATATLLAAEPVPPPPAAATAAPSSSTRSPRPSWKAKTPHQAMPLPTAPNF